MLDRISRSWTSERGFTLIELLVVILIIGILAAIAIPSFLNQKGKAVDSAAKELARTAQTTTETYAAEHNGEYTGLSTTELSKLEKSIPTSAAGGNAYLSGASSASAFEYSVTAKATNGDTFTIEDKAGVVTRKCEAANAGGCNTTTKTW